MDNTFHTGGPILAFCGDVHGSISAIWNFLTYATPNSCLVQVGDFGVGFASLQTDLIWLKKLNRRLIDSSVKLYVVAGNHDNKWFWSDDAKTHFSFENIIFMKDFSVHTILGRKIGVIGGGVSVDRKLRTVGRDYWADEKVADSEDYKSLIDLDILVTHTTPDYFSPFRGDFSNIAGLLRNDILLESDLREESALMAKYYNWVFESSPKLVSIFYGHFHREYSMEHNGIAVTCLDINQIEKV